MAIPLGAEGSVGFRDSGHLDHFGPLIGTSERSARLSNLRIFQLGASEPEAPR